MIFFRRTFTIALVTLIGMAARAQDRPIGYWESHLSFNTAIGVATNGSMLYTIYDQGFATFNSATGDKSKYAKETGMSDIGMQCIGYDASSSTVILVYANGNIDLFKDNTFYNIPDLKVKSVAGSKTVNAIYTENGTAYLSTSLGVLVIDLSTRNINETYQFNINNNRLPVTGFIGSGNYFYAATTSGLFRADKNNPALQNFLVWQRIDSLHTFSAIANVNDTLFLSNSNSVYALVSDTIQNVYTSLINIQHIDAGNGQLLISEFDPSKFRGDIKMMGAGFQIIDTFAGPGHPVQAVQLSDNSIWLADAYYGLEKRNGANSVSKNNPDGPTDPGSFDIYVNNKDLWIAHGGYDDKYYNKGNRSGISHYSNGTWNRYIRFEYGPFDTLIDFIGVIKDESNGTLYFGSYYNGLFILNADASYQLLNTSVFDPSPSVFGNNQRQVTGIGFDKDNNLWVTALAEHQLYVRAASDGNWYKFQIPNDISGGPLTIDDNGQVWFISNSNAGGVTVFQPGSTFADPGISYHLSAGVGNGNLPSNKVFCVAKDKNNDMWIGTDNGIGIVSNCSPESPPCDANIPIVQYDQFAGYLFSGSAVKSIAVDGGNRKWVGTDDGVWLLSPDATKIIYRFTRENSPMPSDNIQKIAIDKVTGDVYIGTSLGLVSYHSTATEGGQANKNVTAFPNPVPSGYTGTIAVKGLVNNADVRITDIDGQLVYKTKALGGQAVWNCRDYTGHRPQSGVYLIFASGSDGAQTYQGKIVFMK